MSLYALVGMKHRGTEALVRSLPAGEPLALVRESMNVYDRNAVQVWARHQHIGFISRNQNRDLAARMDREPAFAAMLSSGVSGAKLAISEGKWPMVAVAE